MLWLRGKCTQKCEYRAGVSRAGLMHGGYNGFLWMDFQGNNIFWKQHFTATRDNFRPDNGCTGHKDIAFRIFAKSGHFVSLVSWHWTQLETIPKLCSIHLVKGIPMNILSWDSDHIYFGPPPAPLPKEHHIAPAALHRIFWNVLHNVLHAYSHIFWASQILEWPPSTVILYCTFHALPACVWPINLPSVAMATRFATHIAIICVNTLQPFKLLSEALIPCGIPISSA